MTVKSVLTLGFIALVSFLILAQEAAGVNVTQSDTLGKYLTDADGKSLYLFTNDTPNTSACYDDCASNWPPLLADGKVAAGQGVAGTLLGTTERTDGTMQVTYNGWPLYYFAKDTNPGDTTGHGVGEVWYLLSPFGEAVDVPKAAQEATSETSAETSTEAADPMTLSALKGEGQTIYVAAKSCVECHGQSGDGPKGPKLAGNRKLANTEHVLQRILRGTQYMPGFADELNDREIAAVATYVRNSWGNEHGLISEEEVSAQR